MDDGDVGMVQGSERSGFALESRETLRILRESLGQDLDGNVPPEVRIRGAVHLTHAPGSDLSADLVWAQARAGGE